MRTHFLKKKHSVVNIPLSRSTKIILFSQSFHIPTPLNPEKFYTITVFSVAHVIKKLGS